MQGIDVVAPYRAAGHSGLSPSLLAGTGRGSGTASRAIGTPWHAAAGAAPAASGSSIASATDRALPVIEVAAAAPVSARRGAWPAASVALLLADYPTSRPVRDIAAELGRSPGAIYAKARRLDLKRPRREAAPGGPGGAAVPRPPDSPSSTPALQLVLPGLPAPEPRPKGRVERTKSGGRAGLWTRDDGAMSVRLERLFLAGFRDTTIAAVLGVTPVAVFSRAWAINLPRRDPKTLRDDVETARWIDREAAPLPEAVACWRRGKVLTRRRCNVKGDPFWGERGSRYSNDARRLHLFQALRASEPLHAC